MFFVCSHRGFTVISFVSIVTASSVLATCGWIMVANEFRVSSPSPPMSPRHPLTNNNNTTNNNETREWMSNMTVRDNKAKTTTGQHQPTCSNSFREGFLRCSVIALLIAVSQLVTSVYLLTSHPHECRIRGRIWLLLNMFLNIVYLIIVIFLATGTANDGGAGEDSPRCFSSDTHLYAIERYLPAFYVVTITTFVTHYLCLIGTMLLLRYDSTQYNGYSLVSVVQSD